MVAKWRNRFQACFLSEGGCIWLERKKNKKEKDLRFKIAAGSRRRRGKLVKSLKRLKGLRCPVEMKALANRKAKASRVKNPFLKSTFRLLSSVSAPRR